MHAVPHALSCRHTPCPDTSAAKRPNPCTFRRERTVLLYTCKPTTAPSPSYTTPAHQHTPRKHVPCQSTTVLHPDHCSLKKKSWLCALITCAGTQKSVNCPDHMGRKKSTVAQITCSTQSVSCPDHMRRQQRDPADRPCCCYSKGVRASDHAHQCEGQCPKQKKESQQQRCRTGDCHYHVADPAGIKPQGSKVNPIILVLQNPNHRLCKALNPWHML
jgi:hypothetical protein